MGAGAGRPTQAQAGCSDRSGVRTDAADVQELYRRLDAATAAAEKLRSKSAKRKAEIARLQAEASKLKVRACGQKQGSLACQLTGPAVA